MKYIFTVKDVNDDGADDYYYIGDDLLEAFNISFKHGADLRVYENGGSIEIFEIDYYNLSSLLYCKQKLMENFDELYQILKYKFDELEEAYQKREENEKLRNKEKELEQLRILKEKYEV